MSLISIIEGSFPKQTTDIVSNGPLRKKETLSLKTYSGDVIIYQLRGAILAVETVIEHKIKPTIKVNLKDGDNFIAQTDKKTANKIRIAGAIPKTENTPFKEIILKKKTKSSGCVLWEWYLDQSRSERIAVIVMIVFASLCVWKAATWNDAENAARNAAIEQAKLAKPLTPAEIEQQAQEAEKNREQRRQERAAAAVNEVKGYETFLAEDEASYKAQPANKADLEKIRKTLALFDGLAESLNKGRQMKVVATKDDQAYLKGIENRLSKLQQKTLPGLRMAFSKQADQILWEYNVDVTVSGNGKTTVNFISSMFADNGNIKATQQQINEIVTKLRFKQTRYSWYEGSEYQYYTLKTPPDSRLAMFKFDEFQNLDK